MVSDHLGHLISLFDFGAHTVDDPLPKNVTRDVDLLAVEGQSKLFLVEPAARNPFGRHLGHQRIELGACRWFEAVPIPEQHPAQSPDQTSFRAIFRPQYSSQDGLIVVPDNSKDFVIGRSARWL